MTMGTSCERILATVDEATTGLAGVELPGDVWAGILADLRQQSPRGHDGRTTIGIRLEQARSEVGRLAFTVGSREMRLGG
jgi:hypothetical protein